MTFFRYERYSDINYKREPLDFVLENYSAFTLVTYMCRFTPNPENELKKETHTKNDMSLQKAYKIKLSI